MSARGTYYIPGRKLGGLRERLRDAGLDPASARSDSGDDSGGAYVANILDRAAARGEREAAQRVIDNFVPVAR